jgi:hypothetical protein
VQCLSGSRQFVEVVDSGHAIPQDFLSAGEPHLHGIIMRHANWPSPGGLRPIVFQFKFVPALNGKYSLLFMRINFCTVAIEGKQYQRETVLCQ